MIGEALPSLFIGSSVEALDVAYALQEGLDFDAEPTVWSQGIFTPTKGTLSTLLTALPNFAFAVFVFSPDDIVKLRGSEHRAVRDNVLFEFGLFVGKLGPDRSFYLVPRSAPGFRAPDFHLPTDLLGTTALTYRANRTDGNLVAALGPACNQVRRAMRHVDLPAPVTNVAQTPPRSIEFYERIWVGPGLREARSVLREGVTDHYDEDWPRQRHAIQTIFAFLESVSEGVISGALDDAKAKALFGTAVESFWPVAATMLAPPNHADDWWSPLPKLAELYARWKAEGIEIKQ